MLKSYLDHMVAVRDRAAKLAANFGIPDIKEMKIVYPNGDHLLISPNPFISEEYPEPEAIEGLDIQGLTVRFEVRGISRRYSESQLRGEGFQYLVGESLCNLIRITENMTTWDMELIYNRGQSEINKPFYV